nr:MAG TPA: hypothetical protein [Bacteriophage sp.]
MRKKFLCLGLKAAELTNKRPLLTGGLSFNSFYKDL